MTAPQINTHHTPGPWSWDEAHYSLLPASPRATDVVVILEIASQNGRVTLKPRLPRAQTKRELAANDALIAAAPDLYVVLAELEESAGYWSEYDVPVGIVDRIRSALAKARGE